MAQWPAEEVDRYLRRPLKSYTPLTIVDPETVRHRLAEIASQGFCWVREEFAEGINSVAAPVFSSGHRVLGAIHVHGPAYRFPQADRAGAVAEIVKEAAHRFSVRLTEREDHPIAD
jgi:DNA-binding IclR family transcriptional regulator